LGGKAYARVIGVGPPGKRATKWGKPVRENLGKTPTFHMPPLDPPANTTPEQRQAIMRAVAEGYIVRIAPKPPPDG
jgi:hypothetical protein